MEKSTPSAGSHSRSVGNQLHTWSVTDLWEQSASLPIEEVDPQSVIDLDRDGWFTRDKPTPRAILHHMKRILDADLSYPVILHPDGSIMDGGHRVCKAMLLGHKTVRVVRFPQTPPPSQISEL